MILQFSTGEYECKVFISISYGKKAMKKFIKIKLVIILQ